MKLLATSPRLCNFMQDIRADSIKNGVNECAGCWRQFGSSASEFQHFHRLGETLDTSGSNTLFRKENIAI
ncbi:hypothetical protein ACFX13_021219 [Malus domestica]